VSVRRRSASGLVANTITIDAIERTWKMMTSSVNASMMGNSGSSAAFALPASSIDPAVSSL
jgi:hypothetical protein